MAVTIALVLFLLASTINELKAFGQIGKSPEFQNVLPVTGKGEILVVPNIGSFTFTVSESGANVGIAQDKATEKNNKAIGYLKGQGIEAKDIQTVGYNAYPEYEYVQATGKQNLKGYKVDQITTVKIRKADQSGEILSAIGALSVANVSGLTFTVDDQDILMRQARDAAISDAREQAKKLADQLGLRIGKVVGYYESGPAFPMYNEAMNDGATMMKGQVMSATPPQIEVGQQKVTSTVTVNFEIK